MSGISNLGSGDGCGIDRVVIMEVRWVMISPSSRTIYSPSAGESDERLGRGERCKEFESVRCGAVNDLDAILVDI